jgi:molybdopterin/thiamine biosynthesis adenylyltransferase
MQEYLQRNLGVLTQEQLERLRSKTVAIAGVGGVGGLLAERLSRTGLGELRLADPDVFQATDMNRQFGCSTESIGRNKATVLQALLHTAAPCTTVHALPERISSANVDDFIKGSDLVACEIHAEAFEDIVAVCEAARRTDIPVIATSLCHGFGAAMCIFSPSGPNPRMLLEYLHWREGGGKSRSIDTTRPPEPLSSTSPACSVAAGITSAEIVMSLAGVRPLEIFMPKILVVDPEKYRMEILDLGPFIQHCENIFDSYLMES